MTTLLKSEQQAKAFVEHYGRIRVARALSAVCQRIKRRIEIANNTSFGQFFDEGSIKTAEWERELIYKAKLGLMLTNTDTPALAHARIIERRRQQKEAAQARRSAQAA